LYSCKFVSLNALAMLLNSCHTHTLAIKCWFESFDTESAGYGIFYVSFKCGWALLGQGNTYIY
jgi:hypothetical protein